MLEFIDVNWTCCLRLKLSNLWKNVKLLAPRTNFQSGVTFSEDCTSNSSFRMFYSTYFYVGVSPGKNIFHMFYNDVGFFIVLGNRNVLVLWLVDCPTAIWFNFPGFIKYHATCLVPLLILWKSTSRGFNAIVYVTMAVGSPWVISSRGLICLPPMINNLSHTT